jgi:peptidoglycan-N-acetylglucosamine deacetylase
VRSALTWLLPAAAPVVAGLADALAIERRLPEDGPRVALTFDDGPHKEGTPAALELLRAAGVRATFFLIGEQVERNRSLAAEIAAAGHEIALHGYRHRLLLRRTVRELAGDLERAVDVIGDATGVAPVWYRPPYGVFSSGALRLVRERGWHPMLWSRWGRDWTRSATPASIARRLTDGLAAGDVLLLHDADHYSTAGSWQNTVAALPRVFEAAQSLSLRFETLSGPR